MTAFKFRSILLLALAVIPVIFLAAAPPLAQPLWYHDFADQRTLLALPHFFNVASNLPFLLVGGWGLWFLAPARVTIASRNPANASSMAFFLPRCS